MEQRAHPTASPAGRALAWWCLVTALVTTAIASPSADPAASPATAGVTIVDPALLAADRAAKQSRRVSAATVRPQLASRRPPASGGGPFAPTATPSLDGSPVEYLVLTSANLAPVFQRLAAHKTARGVPAVVRTLDDVAQAGQQGSDLAETLRLYIRDAYLYWGVRFVLLGGDVDVLPPRYATAEFLGLHDPVTDLYFSCLDRDWNADGDAFFGEAFRNVDDTGDDVDLVAEVFVGRATVSTPAEADLFVDKCLEYERPSVLDWQDKALVMAEVLFPVDWSAGQAVTIDGANFGENLRNDLFPPATRLTRLYQRTDVYPGVQELSVAGSVAAIDGGHNIVVHIGHGWRYTLSVGDGSLDVGEAAGFVNTPRSGLVYMLNCTATAFDFECFAETMLQNPAGGATAVIGAAREAFPLASSDYQYAFFRHLYQLGQHRLGEAMARSREEFIDSSLLDSVDRWTQFGYTLLGDPELSLWTRTPAPLGLAGGNGLVVGAQSATFTVTDGGGPVAGARVCARKAGEEYRVGITNALGQVTLGLEPRSAGDFEIVATAVDHLQATATRAVLVPARALVVADAGLTDDGAGSGAGNSDGRTDAGETVRLAVAVRNAGSAPSTGITAQLETTEAAVQILSSASAYPNLAAGATASAATPFTIRVAADVPDQHVVLLTLRLTHDATVETRRLELLVHAARPRLVAARQDDARAGDGDGVQEAGEEVDLYYTVENLGSGALQAGEIQLQSLDAGLAVLLGTAALPAVPPGAAGETLTRLTVRENDVVTSHAGSLALVHLQDPLGAPRTIDLRLPPAPAAPEFVPAEGPDLVHLQWTAVADPDVEGYHVYRATTASGPWARADADLVRSTTFRDVALETSRRYWYRLTAVDRGLREGAPGPAGAVSTNPPQVTGWPLATNDPSSSSLGIGDVDADGVLDVVAGSGQIYAWRGTGEELVDADQNPVTWGLLYGTNEAFGSITLADLDRDPGKEIVAVTWDGTARYVAALHGDGRPLLGWPRPLVAGVSGSQVAPVVVNLDATGAPEILVAARDGRLYGWHADGSEIADGDVNPATSGVLLDTGSPFLRCAPGVADLDPTRPGLEVVVGGTSGVLYAIDARGRHLPGWPRVGYDGTTFASGVSIADLDRNGTPEIVVLDGTGRLHAMHLDGSELAAYPIAGLRALSQSVVPSPALGDLDGDARLEIAIAGSDGKLYVFDALGTALLPGGFLDSGGPTESSPILGDVDGDPGIEIVLGNEEGVLQAWNLDGTSVAGFPIMVGAEARGTPTLEDVDGDGDADLALLAWDGIVRIWDLGVPWRPERAPWPTARGNLHRTGEFGYQVPTPVAVADLAALRLPDGGVRLAWRGSAGAGEQPVWSVRRAGPFQTRPLGTNTEFFYTGTVLGERLGTGPLEFVDATAVPGAWYAYVLGVRDRRDDSGAQTLFGPLVVDTAPEPRVLRILGNVPNPFNPTTRLEFEVPSRTGVVMVIYDARGRAVRTLLRGALAPGRHVATWDGRDDAGAAVASGVYVARLAAGAQVVRHKLALVR